MSTLTLLYDPECGLCRRVQGWLAEQPKLVELRMIPIKTDAARRRYPQLNHDLTGEDLTAISDQGAVYFGPGSSEQGIAELKKYGASLPKDSSIVLYCGCCPLEKCPNLRPAFSAMKDFGFARLRVLLLPTNFNTDWVEKGYPVQTAN